MNGEVGVVPVPVAGRGSLFTNVALGRVVVLVIGLSLLSYKLAAPFTGHHEWNSAEFCIFARNHVAWGLRSTKLFCTWGNTAEPPAEPVRYVSHPPLIAVWTAIPLAMFGDREWAGRLVPIAFTLASAWLLMIVVGRLHSPGLGVLAGLFYVTLPATAYFGRMIDHHPPGQFFSLLMLHGYLHLAGLLGDRSRRRQGWLAYILGTVLGIWTAWVVAILAALIWAWHLVRRDPHAGGRPRGFWLAAIPAAALAGVFLHLLWGCGWDWRMPLALLSSRTFGPHEGLPDYSWRQWLVRVWGYLETNVTVYGAIAAAVYLAMMPVILARAGPASDYRRIVRSGSAAVPILLLLLQGLLYVVVFRNQSWIHDYWQYLLNPFFAVALAAVVVGTYTLLSHHAPSLAGLSALLVIFLLPVFARGRAWLHQTATDTADTLAAFERLAELIPERVPAMTSVAYPQMSEQFASVTSRWWMPQIEYYSRRPLFFTRDLQEVLLNRHGCAAYLLAWQGDEETAALGAELTRRYEAIPVGKHHVIFRLDRRGPSP